MIRYLLIIGALIGLSWYSIERYYDSQIIGVITEAADAEIKGNHSKSKSLTSHVKNKFGRNSIDSLIGHIGKKKAPVLEKQICQQILGELSMKYSRGTQNSAATLELLRALDKSFDIDFELLDFVSAVKLSESRDPWDRLAAVKAIGYLKKQDGLRTIKILLSDPYWLVRVECLKTLLKMSDNSFLSKAIEMIADPVPEVQVQAAVASEVMSEGNYSGSLFKALEKLCDSDFAAAARAYGQMNNPKVYPILAEKMTSPDPKVSIAAAAALARLGNDKGLNYIKIAIVDGDSNRRRLAAASLSGVESEDVVNMLIIASSDSEAAVRVAAISSLGDYKGPKVFSVLKAALTDKDPEILAVTLTALGKTGLIKAGELIGNFLKHTNEKVVKAAVNSVVKLQDEGAVPNLVKLLNSDHRAYRILAWNGLKKLTGKEYDLPD